MECGYGERKGSYNMIDLAKKFFNKSTKKSFSEQGKGQNHDVSVATCALLLEMADIDGEFSQSEKNDIISFLKKDYSLSNKDAADLISASREELNGSIDLWQFACLINENYTLEKKIHVIETIWKVVYADGRLDKHEDYLIHKLGKLLRLNHKQLIDSKIKVKEMFEKSAYPNVAEVEDAAYSRRPRLKP